MKTTGKYAIAILSLVALIAVSIHAFAAEGGSSRSGSGGKQEDAQTSQQQRSDKTDKQPMASQESDSHVEKQSINTGADLSRGRDSHLGPHDAQESQIQKKDKKGGRSSTGR